MQFSAFCRKLPCETTATRKVKVKPLIHANAGTIYNFFNNQFLLALLVIFEPAWQRYLASQKPKALPTELFERPSIVSLSSNRCYRAVRFDVLPNLNFVEQVEQFEPHHEKTYLMRK